MKATIESTDVITSIDGRPARVWKGTTEQGIRFMAFVARLAVEQDLDCSQFESELVTAAPPRELTVNQVFDVFSTRML